MTINPALSLSLPLDLSPQPSPNSLPDPSPSFKSIPSRLSDLIDQLSLTVQCLDHSVPLALPDDPVFTTLSRFANLLDADPVRVWPDLDASLKLLFASNDGPLNVKRGIYGVQSVLSFVQHAKLHQAWPNRDLLLLPFVDLVLRCVVARCTQPHTPANGHQLVPLSTSDTLDNLQSPTEHSTNDQDHLNTHQNDHLSEPNRQLVSPSNPLNRLIQELQNGASPSGGPNNNKKRHSTTVAHKLEVIDFHNKTGATQKQTAIKFGLTQSQLSRWLKEEEDLREYVLDNGTASKRQRTGDFPQIEDSLLRFFIEAKSRNIAPSDDLLKERTKSFMKLYEVSDLALKVSNGWLLRFKGRNSIKSFVRPVSPFEAYPDIQAVRQELQSKTDSFALKDIYVAGEAGLFCNLAPLTGSLDVDPTERLRLTYLLCTNADGSDKRIPLIVGRSQERMAFELPSGSPPFWYRYQTHGWMTGSIFAEWVRKFDRDMQRHGRRVVLLIESLDRHVYDPETLVCTTVLLVPPGMAPQVVPLQAGIVKTFKSNYRRSLMEAHSRKREVVGEGQAGEQRQAIECGQGAWEQVTSQTIRNCFEHTAIVSTRLADGLTVAVEEADRVMDVAQYAGDLEMEKSLMATQSALIQLERDMGLREGSQMTIEEVLELDGESSQPGWESMPTDAELVAESQFYAAQLQEEIKERKKEVDDETSGSNKAARRGGRGRKRKKREPRQQAEGGRKRWAPGEKIEYVPMSVQEMISGIEELEYSIGFYLDEEKLIGNGRESYLNVFKKLKEDLGVVMVGV